MKKMLVAFLLIALTLMPVKATASSAENVVLIPVKTSVEDIKEIRRSASILVIAPGANKMPAVSFLSGMGLDAANMRCAETLEAAQEQYPEFKPNMVATAGDLSEDIISQIVDVYKIPRNAIISLPGIGTDNLDGQAIEEKINEWLVTQV